MGAGVGNRCSRRERGKESAKEERKAISGVGKTKKCIHKLADAAPQTMPPAPLDYG